MTDEEFEDLENDLASWLKPCVEGRGDWAKAMQRIDAVIKAETERCLKIVKVAEALCDPLPVVARRICEGQD